jgi:hypothetical protein
MLIVKDPEINMIPLEGGYPNCSPIALGGTALLVGRDSSELREETAIYICVSILSAPTPFLF